MLNLKKIISLLLITTGFINAYEFSFFNKTSTPIAIAIQFANSEQEPLYKIYIKPGTMKSFVPGKLDNINIPDIKWSFCLKNVFYVKNPTMKERAHNFALINNWKRISINWTNQPLETTKKQFPLSRKQNKLGQTRRLVTKKNTPQANKSLCKDRHFEIIEDNHGNIVITGSIIE